MTVGVGEAAALQLACPKDLAVEVVSQVRHRIVDGTAKQILAVVKFRESHVSSLRAVAESRFMSLPKS